MTKSHTANNLENEIKKILIEWGILKKVVTISADGASNIKKVCHEKIFNYLIKYNILFYYIIFKGDNSIS